MYPKNSRQLGLAPTLSSNHTIGVVIPTFNSAKTIWRALESVRQQTLSPEQVVVVDNASTDDTCAEVQRFFLSFPETRGVLLRLESNFGPGHARNIGWDQCQTSLVAFLDSDDSWHPKKLELQSEMAHRHPEVNLFGHRYLVLDGTNPPERIPSVDQCQIHRYSLRHFLVRNRLSTPTVMLRTKIPQRFPVDIWFAEDFSLWTRIVAQSEPALFTDAVLAYLYKPTFGSSGLSARLSEMHRGELDVLTTLRKSQHIGIVAYVFAFLWMRVKYIRRRLQQVVRE